MSAIVEQKEIITDDWRGLYREGWKGLITEAAFAHPAKFSRALIRRIYDHAIEEGWLTQGDRVVDPFGGVALGGFDAMRHGLHWMGVELEPRFVGLGAENISLWNERFSSLPQWGTARLIQGDSRRLASVVEESNCCVSSPPYAQTNVGNDDADNELRRLQKKAGRGELTGESLRLARQGRLSPHEQASLAHYGKDNPANLGNLRATDTGLAAAISSPPYAQSLERAGGIDPTKSEHIGGPHSQMNRSDTRYGSTTGQLRAMKEGNLSAAISSPPFAESLASDDPVKRGGLFRDEKRRTDKTLTATYGTEPGNLGLMKATISSPPYEGQFTQTGGGIYARNEHSNTKAGNRMEYGESSSNVGQLEASDFWSAAKIIVEQLHKVLSPNAHAIWVVKGFIRNKALVDFPSQWQALCEAVGFETLHIHRCWLVEYHGEQQTFSGEIDSIETHRKSFFRRLHEKKYPDLSVDYETVLCMRAAL